VGLLTPVQVPHEKQPQIQHESLKNSEFLVSCAWKVALAFNLIVSQTFLKFN
jgi:hypothetical protein